jgi:hypothetical protein
VFCTLITILLVSCQTTPFPGSDSVISTGEGVEFKVTSTQGLIQVRNDYDNPWRFLKSGEVLKPEYIVRTGFNSSADLIMFDNGREVTVRLGSLLPEFELYEAYDKVLSPEASKKRLQDWLEKEGDCSRMYPLTVCRSSLNPVKPNDFLAVANANLEMKNQQAGRSSAVGGSAASGGGGGGGCGPGG